MPRKKPLFSIWIIALLSFSPLRAQAQCQFDWRPDLGSAQPNEAVYAMTTWDPDGAGPAGEWLVIGGNFTQAGGQPANHIIAWDGVNWHTLGTGVDDQVFALATHEGTLIAGGSFLAAGGQPVNCIASWNGKIWQPLGSGMSGGPNGTTFIAAMTEFQGDLIAAGSFDIAGGVNASRIARWNGTSWQPLGAGFTGGNIYKAVTSLCVYQNNLVAGGGFSQSNGSPLNNIAQWNGSQWLPLAEGLGPSLGSIALSLQAHQGKLYAGGIFDTAGSIESFNVASWDGDTWESVGGGLVGSQYPYCFALGIYNGMLTAGGQFLWGNGEDSLNNISQWNGKNWLTMGTGTIDPVRSICTFQGELIIGGEFVVAGKWFSEYFARWGPICLRGDMNCDNTIDLVDVPTFADVILDPQNATDCQRYIADVATDGNLDGQDIPAFTAAILTP